MDAGSLFFIFPASLNRSINLSAKIFSSSSVRFFCFSSISLYSGVLPYNSFACLEYSSNLLLSKALKSICFTPNNFIPSAKFIKLSICSFLSLRSSICCSKALLLSKSGLFIIALMSLSGNSNSRNSSMC